MENTKKALEMANRMVKSYENNIVQNERKAKLLEIAGEYEEAKKYRWQINFDQEQLQHYSEYVTALEYYMENQLKVA